jgi:hypothetical protein
MAPPILKFNFLGKLEYTLRATCLVDFFPGITILLVQGILSKEVVPAIGILPLFFSAILGCFLISRAAMVKCNCQGLEGHPATLVVDMLIGIGLMVVVIITWVKMKDWVMLGTYGTVFLIINW